ncbi:ImmA/IrrE family metallo-endopeptidase [Allorhizocola rhizosphaerae]|uniref:ImmA/IrrE family metallo-endopeptidase n=1 Tax=Allorhizocola rhizosphaerae TaxID=1872709 RepID=UPI000E3B574B|nr:ImmA/IrrE family metallo-endopeptidase [Allorhizocola rhizosphaerae]
MNALKEKIRHEMRSLVPRRISSLGHAQLIAERKATLLVKLLRIPRIPIDVFAVAEALQIEVEMRPRYLMANVSGRTVCSAQGGNILINQNATLGQRRMTLAHEIKHALDDDLPSEVFSNLGHGNDDVRSDLIEKTCDHFAACLLIPRKILRRAWSSGIQEPQALADLFEVSTSAMIIHLQYWGFTNEKPKPPRHYFGQPQLKTVDPAWITATRRKWRSEARRQEPCPMAAQGDRA